MSLLGDPIDCISKDDVPSKMLGELCPFFGCVEMLIGVHVVHQTLTVGYTPRSA